MSYPRLATRLYNSALLITPSKAEVIEQVFRAHQEGRAALLSPTDPTLPREELQAPGMSKADAGYYRTSTGIALIPVVGTLVQRGDSMDAASGLVGYNAIASQLQAAVDDPRVGAILLEIDSNGGELPGLIDLATKVYAANARKPTWAIANEQTFSAAYWIASAAGRISAPESAMVGSIGIVMMHVDQSVKDAKSGITYTPIYAGARKVDFSAHAPLSDEAMAIAQEAVDSAYEMFVNAVATNRNMDPQAVRDTEAGLFAPKVALQLGLIDAVESFDATLEALAIEAQRFRMHGGLRRAAKQGADMDPKELDAKLAAAKAEGVNEGKSQAVTEAQTAATTASTAERTRIAAIQNCEAAKGKPILAAHLALETDMTAEQATALLAKAAVEVPGKPANPLAASMPPNPKVTADAGEGEPTRRPDAAKIYASRKLAAVK
jgi:signal peptide peptidase SppA